MISVTILTKNNERHLPRVLKALEKFDEVLLFDNGSTDETLTIASRYPNVVVHTGQFIGFGPTHNLASSLAKHDWVLSVDSDEVLSAELAGEILGLEKREECVYSFPRHNYYNGRWIRGCGWFPDRVIRLYHRKKTRFCDAEVHEAVQAQGMQVVPLQHPLAHYSYNSLSEFIVKMQSYSDLFARQYCGKRSSSPCKAVLHSMFAFFKSYFMKKGFKDGYEGFIISSYNAITAFYKYLKLYEANKLFKTRRCPDEKASCLISSTENHS